MKTKVTCVKCPKCGDVIYSRAHHDFHYCSCTFIAIDGGFEYTRILGYIEGKSFSKFIMGVSRKDLYDDWNNRTNKYGKIKGEIK